MSDIEARIALLEAREQIKELQARYAWHAARGDVDSLVNLFLPDGIFEVPGEQGRVKFCGHAAISEQLAASIAPGSAIPLLNNQIVEVRGDEAVSTCAMQCQFSGTMAERFPNGVTGYYHDRVRRRHDGLWLFAERRWFLYFPIFEDGYVALPGGIWSSEEK